MRSIGIERRPHLLLPIGLNETERETLVQLPRPWHALLPHAIEGCDEPVVNAFPRPDLILVAWHDDDSAQGWRLRRMVRSFNPDGLIVFCGPDSTQNPLEAINAVPWAEVIESLPADSTGWLRLLDRSMARHRRLAAPLHAGALCREALRRLPLGIRLVDSAGRVRIENPLFTKLDASHRAKPKHAQGKIAHNRTCVLLGGTHSVRSSGDAAVAALEIIEDRSASDAGNAEMAQKLEQAQRAGKARSMFLANISHDIRAPLTAILGYAELLLNQEPDPDQHAECIHGVRRNGEHLRGLIDNLLDLSLIEAGRIQPEPGPVRPLELLNAVQDVMEPLAREKGLELKVEAASPLPDVIRSDASRMKRILVNLIDHAIRITEQGQVHLTAQATQGDSESDMIFTITDTGTSLRPIDLEHIFDPFHGVDSSVVGQLAGSRLGLTIAGSLARMLGGGIDVDSASGRGNRFTVRLPIQSPSEQAAGEGGDGVPVAASEADGSPHAFNDPGTLADVHILVVDDSEDSRRLLGFHLRRAGARVSLVGNGQEAFERWADQQQADPIDIVLMDMQMPVMDGYTATRLLRLAGCSLPIIALTADAMSDDRQRCHDSGCSGFIAKPFTGHSLVSAILEHVPIGPGAANPGDIAA